MRKRVIGRKPSQRKRERDSVIFSEKAVQREAVDVAERKWLQCDGGNEGEEGGAIGGKER